MKWIYPAFVVRGFVPCYALEEHLDILSPFVTINAKRKRGNIDSKIARGRQKYNGGNTKTEMRRQTEKYKERNIEGRSWKEESGEEKTARGNK